ncbi:unnamed protein product [Alopecurus aequalis]
MEPAATSFLVARDPPSPKTVCLGQGQGPAQSRWARSAFLQTLCFLLANGFAWGLHRAGLDLGFCGAALAPAADERRRVGLAACAISLVLISNVALHIASVAPRLELRVALWVLAGLAMGLALYFMFAAIRGRVEDGGRWPEKNLHELSPEQRV